MIVSRSLTALGSLLPWRQENAMSDSASSSQVSQHCYLILLRVTTRLERTGLGLAFPFELVSPLSWGQVECQSERPSSPRNDTISQPGCPLTSLQLDSAIAYSSPHRVPGSRHDIGVEGVLFNLLYVVPNPNPFLAGK